LAIRVIGLLREVRKGSVMSTYSYRMLILQGYDRNDVIHSRNASLLARWTPFACGCSGALGISLGSPAYLWALGVLTFIGTVSSRSFYDHIYQLLLRPITGLGEMPRHGAPRRFGCGIGAALFLLSGTGFYLRSPMLSLIPGLIIVPLAFVAALTQWCFASALYQFLFGKDADCH
jgi:hypothetical protein